MITPEQVREALRKSNITQAQLAARAQVSETVLSKWLSGKQGISDIAAERLQRVLDLRDTPSPQPPPVVKPTPRASVAKVKPEPAPDPVPEPESLSKTRSIADVVFELLQYPGVVADDQHMVIDLHNAGSYELMVFLRDLIAIKTMRERLAITDAAYETVASSLLDSYRRKEAEKQ